MKIYINHLLQVCDLQQLEIDKLVDGLTMAGLEVESVSPPFPKINNVVIGKILTVNKHINADRLNICEVDIGHTDPLSIICGAQNVRPGLDVVVALEGAILPNGLEIKKAKIRGVESFGMICSAKELGLSPESSGIIELSKEFLGVIICKEIIGREIYPYIKDKNRYIELNITPNRGDCLSVLGIAREVVVNNGLSPNKLHIFPPVIKKTYTNALGNNLKFPVTVEAPSACPRYVTRIIRDVKPKQTTPEYIKNALILNGINPISLLVDITNYVMLECGQPMHVFDLDKISKGIVVRHANSGERVKLLDNREYELNNPETLIIADYSKPLALAGIMGGLETSVSEDTSNILLESAFFIPEKIIVTSQQYAITTDSSSRFSR
jgi:phenylalanyl-tRNA synthetase beta chain